MVKLITYIGLDVHKNTIVVAVAEAGLRKEVRDYGTIANMPAALKKLIGKLASGGHKLRFCYEAGPCGYSIQRQIATAGHVCIVVAP
jgi:transposase